MHSVEITGTGRRATIDITFKQILTTHRNSRPKIILKKKLNYKFLVSVSHEANIAIAIVIAFEK